MRIFRKALWGRIVKPRFQISFAAIGAPLQEQRERLARAVVTMGHLPVDLTLTRVFEDDPWETIDRHLVRSDYLVLLVAVGKEEAKPVGRARQAVDRAAELDLPVLALEVKEQDANRSVPSDITADLLRRIDEFHLGTSVADVDTADAVTACLARVVDTFERPGLVSATHVGTDLAWEIAHLVSEERGKGELPDEAGEVQPDGRWEPILRALRGNKIHVPLWAAGASEWEDPIEMTLFDFFGKVAPELAVEKSVADLAEFIPSGVCDMQSDGLTSRWLVPPHSLRLWLTDLMALGLIEPSKRKHPRKDTNEYWQLTGSGRRLVSMLRRPILESGGHRHVGYTAEFAIPDNAVHLSANS